MNVVLLNQFFPPAQAPTGRLLADLADVLAHRGHRVTVITSAGLYGAPAAGPGSDPAGVRVERLGSTGRHPRGFRAKLADYRAFFRDAARALDRLSEPPDVLVCMTTPPFLGLLGRRLRRQRCIPRVLWCMDLYPEALTAGGFLHAWNPLLPLLRGLARIERRAAAAVVAIGPDMAGRLHASGARRVETIPVWNDLPLSPETIAAARDLRRARGWAEDDIVLLYSGNMGRAHRAEEFAALAGRLQAARPRVRFVFAGDGPRRDEWAKRWGGVFEFLPPASPETSAAHLLAADVHLISQRPEWEGVVVPSKFQAACALARPVIFAGPPRSAVGEWLARADAGWLLPPGDDAALGIVAGELGEARLRAEKGANAILLHRQLFTKALQCDRLARLVESVTEPAT